MSYASSRMSSRSGISLLVAGMGIVFGAVFARGLWLYGIAIVGIAILGLWPIETVLGAYAFVLPFDAISRLGNSPDGKTLTWYAGALATLVLIGNALLHGKFTRPPRAAAYWLAFLVLGTLSMLWAIDEDLLLTELPTLIGLVGLYFAAACFEISDHQLVRIARLSVAGGVAASLFSIGNFLSGVSTVEARSSLIAGAQQTDPNLYAASLLLPLAVAVAFAFSAKRLFETVIMTLASLTIMIAVLLTMSRGAVLALVAMGAVYIYRYKLSRRVLLALPVVPLVLLALPSLFFSRLRDAIANGGAGRLDIWTAGLSALTRFGLWGAGLANFPAAYQHYAGFAPVFSGYDRPAHNIYLQTAVELGILGIVLLLCAVYFQIRDLQVEQSFSSSNRPVPMPVACEAMSVGVLVAGFFVGMLFQKFFWMVWVFCALAVNVARRTNMPVVDGEPGGSDSFAYEVARP